MMKVWMQGSLTRVAGMVGWFKETCRTLPNSGPASLGFRKFVCESSYGKIKIKLAVWIKYPMMQFSLIQRNGGCHIHKQVCLVPKTMKV